MRNHYAFQCHLRDYASKGNLSFELRNSRVWQIQSFRLRPLVADSRGSLSAVSTLNNIVSTSFGGTWSERTRVQTPPDQNVPGSVKTYPGARRNVPAPT